MTVYQPNAVLGNSRTLVTLGASGEIMSFFYPHVDYPQNVHEGMPAVYLGDPGQGRLVWTYAPEWGRRQSYVPRRNILVTELVHHESGLVLTITDLVHPRQDLFARRFRLVNHGERDRHGVLMQYLHLLLGEIPRKNSARRLEEARAVVQYWRNLVFAMGGTPFFDTTQISKAQGAKADMLDGHLNNQREELGDVDTAFGWNFALPPGASIERLFLISAAPSELLALSQLSQAGQQGFDELYAATDAWWANWLASAHPVALAPEFAETYYRSLAATRLLYDERYGSFLAAPEFDPAFERCGGYGFVWPRDAAEVVLALERAGLPEMVDRFFEWARTAQRGEGYWEQRYWANGELGPGWCSFLDSIQIDQTGSMVFSLGEHATRLPPTERAGCYERYWEVVERASNYLTRNLADNGLHAQAFDLWEKFRGSFTYSNASIRAALLTAATWASARGDDARAATWRAAADRIKAVLLAECWNGTYFARGYTNGQIDWQIDSSMLGVFDPFAMLALEVPEECAMVESMVAVIREHLTKRLPEGEAIMRHQYDDYVDGSAGGVNTLWLARVMLALAQHFVERDPAKSAAYREGAEAYLRTVIARGTGTGLLPELIGSDTTPYWAAPHGWAMASFIQCALMLDALARAEPAPPTRKPRARAKTS